MENVQRDLLSYESVMFMKLR